MFISVQTEQHPITNAIDGTNQWWQSPSIKNGRQFHWVTITLDLRQVRLVKSEVQMLTLSPFHVQSHYSSAHFAPQKSAVFCECAFISAI